MKWISIPKIEEGTVNEDAVNVLGNLVALSDGAGGGGVFADLWSKYLVGQITAEPISDFRSFDQWISDIWEAFYNECETKAKHEGGMLLNKFYDEGQRMEIVLLFTTISIQRSWSIHIVL